MPSTSTLGIQDGVYGAMMVFTYVNGRSADSADVPGLILATSFGASVYDQKKRKAVAVTAGGLVVGPVVGSAVESWLHVDVVPFLGLHSPAAVYGQVRSTFVCHLQRVAASLSGSLSSSHKYAYPHDEKDDMLQSTQRFQGARGDKLSRILD
ncbi:hypothetical protein Bca4012_009695 [Brassica carinata]